MSDDLPMGWSRAALTEVIELHDSKRIPLNQQQRSLRQGIYPYYGANGQVDSIDDFLFEGEYILLAEDGGYFDDPSRSVAYEVSGRFWVNNHAHILSTREIPRKFLTYALNNIDWMSYVGGSTRLKLTQEGMKRVLIPIPPLNEQRRIVDKLDRIGDRQRSARNELNHIPKLIARYKQSVLAAACSGKLTEDWHTNSILSSKNKLVLLSEALLELKTGPFGSVLHKSDYVTDGIPIVNPMHINDGNITPSSEMTISIDKSKELSDFILKSGDVVIARRGVVGRCAVVKPKQDGWLCGTGSMILRPKLHLLPEYLQIFLSSPNTIEVLTADAVGSTMVNLNQRGLLSLEILLPSLEEQKEIVRRVEKMFAKIDKMEEEYQKAVKLCDRLEQATLAKAFRGELVPQDPNDEPASVLLEQVKREKEKGKKGVKSK